MKKSLIIIFIVIVALHFVALVFLLRKDSKEENESFEPDYPPVLVPEPTINQHVNPILKTHVSKKKNIKKTDIAKKTAKKIPRKSGPLNFNKAVIGNIKSLPQSKKVNAGILVDADTRRVLWSKNSKKPVQIASMTKMMTALLVNEDIRDGKISPEKQIKVTKAAASIGGSDVWLDPRETFSLAELMKAIVIKSANDAAYLVAQNIGGGDVENFIIRMNDRAAKLGLKSAKFFNPHGLPEDRGRNNVCSCEDIVVIAEELLKYPEFMKLSSTKITYLLRNIGKVKKTMLLNTNKLIRKGCRGVDGMKTGYTKKAGSCITVTCSRNGKRLILVLTGCKGSKLRDKFATELLDWGYRR